MNDDLIKRSDAIKVTWEEPTYTDPLNVLTEVRDRIEAIPPADRPQEIIYGNEHNCIMTMFGECSYAETGCGDCAVVEKVRKALSADRPQGEWIEVTNGRGGHECSNCHDYAPSYMNGDEHLSDFCPQCGARMKGADDE